MPPAHRAMELTEALLVISAAAAQGVEHGTYVGVEIPVPRCSAVGLRQLTTKT